MADLGGDKIILALKLHFWAPKGLIWNLADLGGGGPHDVLLQLDEGDVDAEEAEADVDKETESRH